MPAHTVAADVGCKRLGNGELLTERDRRGNDAADALAKEAVELHRVPADIRKAIADQEVQVTAMAWWVARVTLAANAWGPHALRDSDSAPVGRRRKPTVDARALRVREEIPTALGGHDLACFRQHLARPWQCRICHRTAAKRETLCFSRCLGSAVLRWARLAATAAASGDRVGTGHHLLLTGTLVWCWRCGAYACARARNLAKPCPGRPSAFSAQARQRLLLGLHPATRAPLCDATVPEPGRPMPSGFDAAVRQAMASATAAAAARRAPAAVSALTRPALADTPRLAQLRARVRAREAASAEEAESVH